MRELIPDPNDPATFAASMLDWPASTSGSAQKRLALFQRLTAIRSTMIAPRLTGMTEANGRAQFVADRGFAITWTLGDGARLSIVANLGGVPSAIETTGRELFRLGDLKRDTWALRVALAESQA